MDKAKVQALVDELYRAHTTAAAEALYLEVSADLFKIAYCVLKDYHLAEDVLHDSISQIFAGINTGAVIYDPCAYMRKTTYYCALGYIKKRKREVSQEEVFPDSFAESVSYVEGEVDARVLSEQLLSYLKEDEKGIVQSHAMDCHTHKWIAQMLRCPESTVRNKYSRSLNKLRAILKQQEQENGGEADAQIDQTRDRGEAARVAQGSGSAGV